MWTISDETRRSLAGHPAARSLFELLETLCGDHRRLPHVLPQSSLPFLLSRDFGTFPWVRAGEAPSEMYKFQLGPRAWSKPIYVYEGHEVDQRLPLYEREAETLAKRLKLAGWEKLAQPLLDLHQGVPSPDKEGECTAQVTLCWQEDGRFLVVHDRKARSAIAFEWGAEGLSPLGEAHPLRLSQFNSRPDFDALRRPVVPLEEGLATVKPAERAGRMDEFMAEVEWRYASRLDRGLDALLLEACDRLRGIEGEIGLAFAGHRFNDACGDDSWLAVRLDNFAWENGAYFRSGAESLRSAPSDIHALLGILVHLQASGVGRAFDQSYGYPVVALDVIGLFRQRGRHYFACANSQGTCGPVYEIEPGLGQSRLCGFTDRFDWNFNAGPRAGGIIPKPDVLEIVTLEEVVRRVESGDTPFKAGPPHDLSVDWMAYLPSDPYR